MPRRLPEERDRTSTGYGTPFPPSPRCGVALPKGSGSGRERSMYIAVFRRRMMKAGHPEICPQCGKPTWNWYYLSTRVWMHCEHCGFLGRTSTTPVGGASTDSESRKMPAKTG